MATSSSGGEWSGDMLDRPEMVSEWTRQLRTSLTPYVDYVASIRRDAEAMWRANPPEGYGTFEAWWRHHRVSGPFAKLQEHLEEAVKLTFEVAAQHRKQRHELPAARKAAAEAKQQQALPRGAASEGAPPPAARPSSRGGPQPGGSFLDMISRDRSA